MRKKILVTGGAGYIGSHTVVELYKAGYDVVIVDNLCNSSIYNLNGINKILRNTIKWYNVDCTDLNEMMKVFLAEKNIIGCIHFAAYKSVSESVENPEKYFNNNIGSLKTLISCMKSFNINFLIFSSSCTVYGNPDILPVDESAPFKKPESPYGETKQECERLIKISSINSVSLRYFNPIGSHHSSLIGDCSADKANNLVPIITEVAIGIRDKLIVNGNDYNTTDGTCVRDYIHVQDLAISHIQSLKYLLENKGKFVFNVGTGKGVSVLEIIKGFEKNNNIKINYSFGKRRKGDVESIFSNGNLIRKKIGWKPQKDIDDALVDAWNWQKKKADLIIN